MGIGTPTALINGIDVFLARKLAESLRKSDIKVIEFVGGDENWSAVEEKIDYVFDFLSDPELWKKVEKDQSRLTVVVVNRNIESGGLESLPLNWRIVNLRGVYGVGMNGEDVEFLEGAVSLAVRNQKLRLPERTERLRLLAEEDALEAIMRSSFMSGTQGEIIRVWGEETNAEEIARVLIEEAKMTRLMVEELANYKNIILGKEEVEGEWKKLRWKPNVDFRIGIKELLQDYFAKADEEGRKPKTKAQALLVHQAVDHLPLTGQVEHTNQRRFEVEIESDEESEKILDDKPQTPEYQVADEDKVKIKSLEEIMAEEFPEHKSQKKEEFEDIRPILVKNSNMRLVQERVEKFSEVRSQVSEKKEELPVVVKIPPVHQLTEEAQVEVKPKIEIRKVKREIKLSPDLVKWGWRGLIGLWMLVFLSVLSWGYSNYRMVTGVVEVKNLVMEKKYVEARELSDKLSGKVSSEEDRVRSWGLNRFELGRRYQTLLKALGQAVVLESKLIDLAKRSESINEGIFGEKELVWNDELAGLTREVKETEEALGLLQARLSGDWGWVPARWKGQFNSLKLELEENKKIMSLVAKAVEILPEFLGADGKRREYMVLLQNESEIRPTGGFIGSYAILSFEGGKLINFDIKDVYEADGQLAGHVEPPGPIKNILGEAKWFMRDANWQPDFVATAKDIQWFLEKSTGRKVDGVIGIDLAVAKGLVGVVGEVYVPDFKTKINKNNLYEQAEFFSETKFFPGSNQKASFLGGLGKQLFEDIKTLKSRERLELAKTMVDLLEKNEIQMSFNNKNIARVVAEVGWDGSLYGGRCASSTVSGQKMDAQCFADYLYAVEANLGVNKANYFIYRNMDLVVDISNQSLSRVLKISYENIAKNSNWPGGDYRNYIRVYIPTSSNLAEVSVTNSQSGVKTIYTGDNLDIKDIYGKKEVGFLVTAPVAGKVVVEMRYTDQIDIISMDKFSYLNYIQRQPGSGDTGVVALVSMPDGWQANQVEPMASLVNGKLLFNKKLEKDMRMGVEIVK